MNTKNSSTIAAFLSIQQFLKHKMAQEYIPVASALPYYLLTIFTP